MTELQLRDKLWQFKRQMLKSLKASLYFRCPRCPKRFWLMKEYHNHIGIGTDGICKCQKREEVKCDGSA